MNCYCVDGELLAVINFCIAKRIYHCIASDNYRILLSFITHRCLVPHNSCLICSVGGESVIGMESLLLWTITEANRSPIYSCCKRLLKQTHILTSMENLIVLYDEQIATISVHRWNICMMPINLNGISMILWKYFLRVSNQTASFRPNFHVFWNYVINWRNIVTCHFEYFF